MNSHINQSIIARKNRAEVKAIALPAKKSFISRLIENTGELIRFVTRVK